MPFITEGIWQHLPHEGEAIMVSAWPKADATRLDDAAEAEMSVIMETVRVIRNVRAEFDVVPSKRIEAIFHAADEGSSALLEANLEVVSRLAGLGKAEIRTMGAEVAAGATAERVPEKAAHGVAPGIEVYMPLAGLIDIGKELERLYREVAKAEAEAERYRTKLANPAFVERAPAEIVARQREALATVEEQLAKIRQRIAQLEA